MFHHLILAAFLVSLAGCSDSGGNDFRGPDNEPLVLESCDDVREVAAVFWFDAVELTDSTSAGISDSTVPPTSAQVSLIYHAPSEATHAPESIVNLGFDDLKLGRVELTSDNASMAYIHYPASEVPRGPDDQETMNSVTGEAFVVAMAENIGERTCGAVTAVGTGTHSIEVTGWFDIEYVGAQPGLQ